MVPNNRWISIYSFQQKEINQWKRDNNWKVILDKDQRIQRLEAPVESPIDVYHFGGTDGMKDIIPEFLLLPSRYSELLDKTFKYRYFHHIIEFLQRYGYRDRETLFGAPYDFRLILDPLTRGVTFQRFKKLIENAVERNGEPSVVVTHSLGGVLLKWMCSECADQAWVDKYIHHWVAISAPFAGSYQALRNITAGDHYVPNLRLQVKDTMRNITGISACLPNQLAFDEHEPLLFVDNPKKVVTIHEYEQLRREGNFPFQTWKDLLEPFLPVIASPLQINTTAVMTKDMNTMGVGHTQSFDDLAYKMRYTLGDGIVPVRSLLAIEKVLDKKGLIDAVFQGEDHTSLLDNERVFQIIKDQL